MRFLLVILIPSLLHLLRLPEFAFGAGLIHGASAASEQQPRPTSTILARRRRRKTPLELITIQAAANTRREQAAANLSYKKNSELSVALDIEAPPKKGPLNQHVVVVEEEEKTEDNKDTDPTGALVTSLQSANRGIVGPKKATTEDDDNNKNKEYPVVQKLNEHMKHIELAVMRSFQQNSMSMMILEEDENDSSAIMMTDAMLYNSISMSGVVEHTARTQEKKEQRFVFPNQDELLRAYLNMLYPSMSMGEETTTDVKEMMLSFESAFDVAAENRMTSMPLPVDSPAEVTAMDGTAGGYVPVTVPTINDGPPAPSRPSISLAPGAVINTIPTPTVAAGVGGGDGEISSSLPGSNASGSGGSSIILDPSSPDKNRVPAIEVAINNNGPSIAEAEGGASSPSFSEPGTVAANDPSSPLVPTTIAEAINNIRPATPAATPTANEGGNEDGAISSVSDTTGAAEEPSSSAIISPPPTPVQLRTSAPTTIPDLTGVATITTTADDKEITTTTKTTTTDGETTPRDEYPTEISDNAEDGASTTLTFATASSFLVTAAIFFSLYY